MLDGKHCSDETPVAEAAREQREGETFVYMTKGELWRTIHRSPELPLPDRWQLAAKLTRR